MAKTKSTKFCVGDLVKHRYVNITNRDYGTVTKVTFLTVLPNKRRSPLPHETQLLNVYWVGTYGSNVYNRLRYYNSSLELVARAKNETS